ncbi:hypothetical protein PT286_03110 [Neisseriaceae bacterium ESL0693]|nr:hypothetical protein [Neisseriaceae bacterium ESL0693]
MKKLILLLSLSLAGCYTAFEPTGNSLPTAKVGQPYHQRIYLYGSIPRTIWVGIGPKDNGLRYRFLYFNPNKKVVTNRGNIIEITGIPNDNDLSIIKIGIHGYGYQGKYDNKKRFEKAYTIKLIPDKNHPPKPAKTTSPPPDIRPPGCIVTYDEIKKDLGCLELTNWDKQ